MTSRAALEPLVLMVAPLAPHLAEELWSRLGHDRSLAHGPFPVADEAYLVEDTVEYPVQVNGKVRGRVTVAADADAESLEAAALADDKVVAFLDGRAPKKVIVVRRPPGQHRRLSCDFGVVRHAHVDELHRNHELVEPRRQPVRQYRCAQ